MQIKRLGLMLDMSRNSVMNVKALKNYISLIAKMGYNTLLLYTEDTYEIPGEPYFGHFRGRYSIDEMKELVDYAESQGVEMIPCIQTLAHLNAIFRWDAFADVHDCNDILLVDEEKTYELIGKMFDAVQAAFHTKLIHIGMDEAHMVGLGKFLDRNGFENRFQILSRHLNRVCKMAEDRGLQPIIWADMFFRLKNHGLYYNVEEPVVPTPEEVGLPENVTLTYWDYYTTDAARFEKMISAHKKLQRPIWYAGGIWTWKGFAPDNQFSLRSTRAAIQACRNQGVENLFFTMWGDNGGECSRYSVFSSVYATACFARGKADMEKIKADFEKEFNIPFDAFDLLDMHEPNDGVYAKDAVTNPEKYLLFNDPFLPICDSTLSGNEAEYYGDLAQKMEEYCEHPQFGIFFRSQQLLAATLYFKADLGVRSRNVYRSGDKQAVKELIDRYDCCIRNMSAFLQAFRNAWLFENKPHGFEVQDIRIGGLLQRLIACRDRLIQWDKVGTPIPELEEDPLDLEGGGNVFAKRHLRYPQWARAASVNVMDKG